MMKGRDHDSMHEACTNSDKEKNLTMEKGMWAESPTPNPVSMCTLYLMVGDNQVSSKT